MGEKFNENLKKAREHKGYTQKEVAEVMNISQSYISRIEKKIIKRLKVINKI